MDCIHALFLGIISINLRLKMDFLKLGLKIGWILPGDVLKSAVKI